MSLVDDGGSLTQFHVPLYKANIIPLHGMMVYSGHSEYLCRQLEIKGLAIKYREAIVLDAVRVGKGCEEMECYFPNYFQFSHLNF
jgi:hypothetical protein